jgi:hypothetical protein
MKRLLSATLALTLLGATAAAAEPYYRGGQGYDRDYDDAYRGHDRDNSGAIVAGVGFLTLAAILASQHRHRHFHDGWFNRGYGERYGDYGSRDHRW